MSSRALPGFRPALGFTMLYLSIVVLIPLAGLFMKTAALTWPQYWHLVTGPRAIASYELTLGTSAAAAGVNGVFGLLVAWVLVRYPFPGRRLIDAVVDLPLALPTAVAGIALTSLYAESGWLGAPLARAGWRVAFTPLGITVALIFIGLPFVVRTVQPVLQDLEAEVEDAASSLGATRAQTFWRVIFPTVLPALVTGTALAFARALGEYGSVVFISGNLPLKTEVTTLLIMTKLEQYDYKGATALATVMLGLSFVMLLTINLTQAWLRRRQAAEPI
jgi:sulfate/thiosulfate transport system permease protein